MSKLLDIIVPTFNQPEFTMKCFSSIERTLNRDDYRLIWVDNGSSAEARALVAHHLKLLDIPVLPLQLPENLGFVKATNMGLAASTADYLLLLNNDTELPDAWFPPCLEVFKLDPRVGIVGPRSSAPTQWQGMSPETPGFRILPSGAMLSFFCALLKREVVTRCGYLSEEYACGLGDDDDYCEVVKGAGWELALRTDVTVLHHHRVTFTDVFGPNGWLDYQAENIRFFKQKWHRK